MAAVRRLPITLLELLIVIAILAMVAGIVAVSINKALVDQRFRTEVSMVVDELRLAQDLMLILGADVHVKFTEDKENFIKYWIELETSLPEHISREVLRKQRKLKTIRAISFDDPTSKQGHLDLKFQSKGMVMSKGILKLATSGKQWSSSAGTLKNYIWLSGYPKPIISYDSEEEALKGAKSDPDFDDKLAQDTFYKLPDKLKQSEEVQKEEKVSSEISEKGSQASKNSSGNAPEAAGKNR